MTASFKNCTRFFRTCALFFLLFVPCSVQAAPSLSLSKDHWALGTLKAGTVTKGSVSVRNTGDAPLEITVRSSCKCVSVSFSERTIPPGKAVGLTVTLSPHETFEDKAYYVFFQSNDPAHRQALLLIETGELYGNEKSSSPVSPAEPPAAAKGTSAESRAGIEVYGAPGCGYCDRLTKATIPGLLKKYGLRTAVHLYPLDDPKNFERLVMIEEKLANKRRRLPAVLIGGTLLEGEEEIDRQLEKEIAALVLAGPGENGPLTGNGPDAGTGIAARVQSLRLLPLIVAGLTDGINPCAFAGIIFLVSYLGLVRKRPAATVALTGIMFIAGIFTIYFLIGLGLSKIFLAVNSLRTLSKIVYGLAGVVTLVLAFLSFHDYYAVSRPEKQRPMILQLPAALRARIFSLIETFGSAKYILPFGFLLGVSISFLEFFCTGQIYLPTIMYMVRVPSLRAHAILYLLLYSFVFVLPLIVILVSLLLGLKNDRVAGLGRRHIKLAKLLTGFVFLALSLLILIFAFK